MDVEEAVMDVEGEVMDVEGEVMEVGGAVMDVVIIVREEVRGTSTHQHLKERNENG